MGLRELAQAADQPDYRPLAGFQHHWARQCCSLSLDYKTDNVPDFLLRDQAPLGTDEWAAIDQTVVRTAQSMLVGRRFISLTGPFGAGILALPNDIIGGASSGRVDLLGDEAAEALTVANRWFLPLPLLYKDF